MKSRPLGSGNTRVFLFCLMTLWLIGSMPAGAVGNNDEGIPAIGSVIKLEGATFIVRGAGNTPFQYKATGESLVIKIRGVSGTMVIVPKRGEMVRVDPSIPMIWVGGREKNEMRRNAYLRKHAKNAVFLLLEYKR